METNQDLGYASGDGSGYGYGYGYGDASGDGSGYGYGYGYGYGDASGDGSGYGSGDGDGYASGYGSGYGSGDGSGYGYGSGYGSGSGYRLTIPEDRPWIAYHYLYPEMKTRDGRKVLNGETLTEPEIELCKRGLHSSLTKEDADQYRPKTDSPLTRVLVWGDFIVSSDKLVSTNRKIVEVL